MAERVARTLSSRAKLVNGALQEAKTHRPEPEVQHRALMSKGVRLASAKRYDEAVTALAQALALLPDHLPTRLALGMTRARRALASRDFVAARKHYEAVSRLDPDYMPAQRELLIIAALGR